MSLATNTASNIFQIRDGDFSSLSERPMRQGFYGETLESALQRLLQEHPEVLPGDQLVSDDEEVPRFLLLKREAPVGSWSLDHLFIDQMGVPTLVECKLIENRESRREVVGQIIEYAANVRAEWAEGNLRELANNSWSNFHNEVDALLKKELAVDDIDAFWQRVDSNIAVGRIRLIIAGDHIHSSVKRMIEYLNVEMRNTEVYGLEVNCYGPDSENVVMMTRVIGRVQAVVDKRAARNGGATKLWTVEDLQEYFSNLENKDASVVAMALLDWACKKSRYLTAKTKYPVLRIATANGKFRIGVYGGDGVWLSMNDLELYERQSMHQDMLDMGLTAKPLDDKKTFVLEGLVPANIQQLTNYLEGE